MSVGFLVRVYKYVKVCRGMLDQCVWCYVGVQVCVEIVWEWGQIQNWAKEGVCVES